MRRGLLTALGLGMLLALSSGCSSSDATPGGGGETPREKPKGCVGKCDSPTDVFVSPWQADTQVMNQIWPGEPAIQKPEDAYTVQVDLGEANGIQEGGQAS